ncbi:MAG: glycosyltransferase family 1 protein [bacterium]|nr:glycosyltransferase family 1 protein [bacterium]
MKIGIDASRISIDEKSGTENYSLNLIKALAKIDSKNHYQLYFNHDPKFFELPETNFASKIIPARKFWTQGRLAAELVLNPVDLLFVPAHTIPILRRPGLKTVVTIHDLGAEYLAAYHKFPDRIYLNWSTAFVANYASHIIAVSEATKKDLVREFKVKEERISVVYEGVDRNFFKKSQPEQVDQVRKKYGLKKPYFLFVGTIQPRKNLFNLIQAFSEARVEADLVIAGKPGWLFKEIYEAPKKFGIEEKVKFLGFTPTEDLPALYSGALSFVFPSLYEGFGLPLLEAMACACPVLTSNQSSLPEVVGRAGLLVNPRSSKEIAQAIEKLFKDKHLRESLSQKGQERTQNFSWEKTARETLAVLEKVGES